MKEFLKKKELIPVWGVLIGGLIQSFIPELGLMIMGGAIGWGLARFVDAWKKTK